jgi:TRAP-type C4-dicarboxylate transport system substrate-binding protein
MFMHRLVALVLVVAVCMLSACASQVQPTAIPASAPTAMLAQAKPITLRLAVADEQDRPSEPYVLAFIEQVKSLSNGNITVEPVWQAGDDTFVGFETGVIQHVMRGDMELGLAASRAFDTESVMSFQALQAPFLITNDAVSKAVATSDIATRMLDNLSSAGVMGLTLWPEDLRHPFSVIPDKPILSPKDFAGLSVRAAPSGATYLLIDTLGGSPMMSDSDYQAAESGLRQGYSLTGTPTATGNVIFFAKFQVLFANGATFEKLNEVQRTVLREAAAATQKKAIAEHPSEVDAATAWCTDGGTIVLASDEQVAAFEKAAQPVFDSIEKGHLNAELIASIRELKAKTEPTPGAEACAPAVAQPSPEPSTETQAWSQGLPPNGVWQAELTSDDFVRMGLLRSVAQSDWAGVYTITFKDGKYLMVWQPELPKQGGHIYKCQANYAVVEDVVRLAYFSDADECVGAVEDIQWRLDGDGLHLHLVATNGNFVEGKAFFEAKPWQKSK